MQYSMKNMTADSFGYSFPEPNKAKQKEAVFDQAKYPESSNQIMCHQEVLEFFDKKRTTIIAWRKNRGFPEPISKSPLRWLRTAVMEWVEHEGGFKTGG